MRARGVLGVAALVAALTACGDPRAQSNSPAPPASEPTPSAVRTCVDDAPWNGNTGPNPPNEATALGELASANPDVFAGVWWDSERQEFVLDAVDVDAATSLAATVVTPEPYRIQRVPRSHTELQALQDRAITLSNQGLADSSSERIWDGMVQIDLRILDQRSMDAVAKLFADQPDAVCVTGADPATVPPDGPQPTEGDGWRLLADSDRHGMPYAVHTAMNQAEYEVLWASMGIADRPPPVDFNTEIVVHFGAVYGSSCPEIRMDGVDIDMEKATVMPHVVLLGGNRGCTADAVPRAYVVALQKDHLPPVPFTVSVTDCGGCDHLVVSDLSGSAEPALDLSAWDRSQIFAAVALVRLGYAPDATSTVDVLTALGHASDGIVDLTQPGTDLTDAERTQIGQALGTKLGTFIDLATFDGLDGGDSARGYTVLAFAEPQVIDGHVAVTVMNWCGNLCGTSGAIGVRRNADGTWISTGPVGPQVEA